MTPADEELQYTEAELSEKRVKVFFIILSCFPHYLSCVYMYTLYCFGFFSGGA